MVSVAHSAIIFITLLVRSLIKPVLHSALSHDTLQKKPSPITNICEQSKYNHKRNMYNTCAKLDINGIQQEQQKNQQASKPERH